jgi:hypothetical protein
MKDLSGNKFCKLTVISFSHLGKHKEAWFNCLCECGSIKKIPANSFTRGKVKSCGCMPTGAKEKHGLAKKSIYQIWKNMISRCYNSKDPAYKNYGARGIKVCMRWHNLLNFYEDMGDMPRKMSLERINNNEDYSKKNCKWDSRSAQARNRRNTKFVKINNETKSLAEWCDIFNIKYKTVYTRINSGWEPIRAIKTPVIHNNPS